MCLCDFAAFCCSPRGLCKEFCWSCSVVARRRVQGVRNTTLLTRLGARYKKNDGRRRARETIVKHVCLSARWPKSIGKYVCIESGQTAPGLLEDPEHKKHRYCTIKVTKKLENQCRKCKWAEASLQKIIPGIKNCRKIQ